MAAEVSLLNPISSGWVSRCGLVRAERVYLLLILEGKLSPKFPVQAAKAWVSGEAWGVGEKLSSAKGSPFSVFPRL